MLKTAHYCIDAKNVLGHELIGLSVVVLDSTDKSRIGINGKVIDESKNTLKIEGNDLRVKIVPKIECVFEFILGEEKVIVDGKAINFAPHDRLRMWRRNHGKC